MERISPGMIGAKSLFSGDEGAPGGGTSPESHVIADIAVIGKAETLEPQRTRRSTKARHQEFCRCERECHGREGVRRG